MHCHRRRLLRSMPQTQSNMQFKGSTQLPEEIVLNVLSYLPAKSIARFTCVSKLWFFLIKEPSFVFMHQQQAPKRPPGVLILSKTRAPTPLNAYRCRVHLCSLNEEAHTLDPVRRDDVETPLCSWITSSCDGFVCLHMDQGVDVWNPTTGEYIRADRLFPGFHSDRFFLGFHGPTKRYKLVQAHKRQTTLCIQMMDLAKSPRRWRLIRELDMGQFSIGSTSVCAADGTLYIPIFSKMFTYRPLILAIDLGEEKVTQLPPPPACQRCPRSHADVFEMEGRLCLGHCCRFRGRRSAISVWVLREDGVWAKMYQSGTFAVEQWAVAYVVAMSDGRVLLRHKAGLSWYHMRSRSVNAWSFDVDTPTGEAVSVLPYVESLLPIGRLTRSND